MTRKNLQNGSGIAIKNCNSSENSTTARVVPTTVADLLAIWEKNPPREIAMLGTTCMRLVDYHGLSFQDLTIDAVDRKRKGFRPFLETRKYGENSIRTYINHVRILLNYASAAGWRASAQVSEEWSQLISLAAEKNCADLARYLSSNRKHPREVTPEDVDQWIGTVAQGDMSYVSAVRKRSSLWHIIRDQGYGNKLPTFMLRQEGYGIPLSQFPVPFREEVLKLLKWKQAVYVYDRPKGARHRPPTLNRLRQIICVVYGYVVNIRGESVTSL